MALLFVYGTLKKGYKNGYILEQYNPKYQGRGVVEGLLINLGPFPGFIPSTGRGETAPIVYGELYEIENKLLPLFDRFEGVPRLYTREELQVRNLDTGTLEMAFIYCVTDGTIKGFKAEDRVIPSGVWVE